MTVDYHRFQQVTAPAAHAMLDTVLLLEQISKASGHDVWPVICSMNYFPFLLRESIRNDSHTCGTDNYSFTVLPQGLVSSAFCHKKAQRKMNLLDISEYPFGPLPR